MILTLALVLGAALSSGAQGVAFIKADSILSVIPEYKDAQNLIKDQADKYRQELEADLNAIDDLYATYQSQKQYLSASARTSRENQIIRLENTLKEKQDKYFGADGEMEKLSTTMLGPVRDRVNAAIKSYAREKGFTMVVDLTASTTIVYYDEKSDITGAVIEKLTNNK